VIVNHEFASRYWPGEDPIGKRLQVGTELTHWREVVGVVGNARLAGLEAKCVLSPILQSPNAAMWPRRQVQCRA